MTNVEIYDSSNSQLSSDEYSNDEDDDALMDVAVSKQADPKSDPKSTEASPSKADSAAITPRELSDDPDDIAGGSAKPPASREVTQRQIKQMQRNNQANLYFKRRSIRWLQRLNKKIHYSGELKVLLPAREAHAKRIAERRAKKHLRLLREMAKRNERTPSRSRSRTHSGSASESEVVCLDDTENEYSPEKAIESVARHFAESVQDLVVKKPNTPLNLKLELGAGDTSPEINILDEFLTMKPAVKAAEPFVLQAVVINDIKKQQQAPLHELPVQLIVEPAANLQMPVAEISLKRCRSVSPPAADSHSDKRTKAIVTDDFDDDIIELLPLQPAPFKQPTPTPPPAIITTPMHKAAVATFRPNIETSNTPAFKLGSPYTLTPSSGMDFYAQKKAQGQQQQQQQQSAISYSLETPTPPVERMEIVYPTAKTLPQRDSVKTAQAASTQPVGVQQQAPLTAAAPYPVQQQQMLQQQQHQQQQHYQQSQPSVNWQKPKPRKVMGQTPTGAAANPAAAASAAAAAPPAHNRSNSTDPNNSNSNASFHQRIRDTFQAFNEIMTDKVNAVTPDLLAVQQEEKRNNADIETLKNLMKQKEDEWNRLLHLLSVKEELAKRIERKTRTCIIKEVLTPILGRNCSASELQELETLLYKEKNATMPSRFSTTAIDKLIESVTNGQDDTKLLKGFLGVPEKCPASAETSILPPPPPQSYYGPLIHRHNSVPAMRPPVPPAAVGRSVSYSRHNDYQWDHHAEREMESLPPRRAKVPPPLSRSQQLINESKEALTSEPDLSASSYRGLQQQQSRHTLDTQRRHSHSLDTQRRHSHSLDNHLDVETSLNPLYYSSPLGARMPPINTRNDTQPQINDQHSIYRAEGQHVSRSNNNTNRSTRLPNGTQEFDPECHHCGRPNADFVCTNCGNQWYCSRKCQTRAWAVEHWQSCTN